MTLIIRPTFNPNGESKWFRALAGLLDQLVMITIILTGAALIRAREHGTIEHLMVMPLTLFEIAMAQFALSIMLTISPMQMLSGGNSPMENQPEWMQAITLFLPSRHFMSSSQPVAYRGAGLDIVRPDFLAMTGLGLAFFFGSLLRHSKSLR